MQTIEALKCARTDGGQKTLNHFLLEAEYAAATLQSVYGYSWRCINIASCINTAETCINTASYIDRVTCIDTAVCTDIAPSYIDTASSTDIADCTDTSSCTNIARLCTNTTAAVRKRPTTLEG